MRPPTPRPGDGARVFMIDNYDSFTYNLVQALREMAAEVTVHRNDTVTVAQVRDAFRKEYYPEAKLAWTLSPVADNPDFVDVAIRAEEGRRAIVRRILFKGNRHVPRRELLKAMTQKQSSWLSWFNGTGVYEPGSLLADRDQLSLNMKYSF